MKISKLFHWLYAILMFLPFVALAFNFVRIGLSGEMPITSFEDVMSLIVVPTSYFGGSASAIISNVYTYLISNVMGYAYITTDVTLKLIRDLLTYWTIISIVYLIFDVLMYVPLLVHRWIDKARLE